MIKWPLVFLISLILSCQKNENNSSIEVIELKESYMDTKIPKQLWEKIESSETLNKSKTYQLGKIKIRFLEKNQNVLKNKETSFNLTKGGNVFDLQDLIGNVKGTFYLSFDIDDEYKDENTKVYFISNSKKRRISDEIIGSGCGKYFDISKKFKDNFVKKSFAVNTTKDRHVSTLAGTFLFVLNKNDQTILSQVSFTDSKLSHLLCEGHSL